MSDNVTFSVTVRLLLANQYRILERVDPESAREHSAHAEILESGFEAEYPKIIGRFNENLLPLDECRFVADILVMCSWLQDFNGKGNLDVSEFEQVGFDANEEWHHMQYARFLLRTRFGGYPGIDDIVDVHHPMLGRYRRMVDAWKQAKRMPHLTEADVARILSSGLNLD